MVFSVCLFCSHIIIYVVKNLELLKISCLYKVIVIIIVIHYNLYLPNKLVRSNSIFDLLIIPLWYNLARGQGLTEVTLQTTMSYCFVSFER
jgi:hypothetical protein